MVDFFKFFKSKKNEASEERPLDPVQMATAVLLIEMARADFDPVSYTHLTLPTTPYV